VQNKDSNNAKKKKRFLFIYWVEDAKSVHNKERKVKDIFFSFSFLLKASLVIIHVGFITFLYHFKEKNGFMLCVSLYSFYFDGPFNTFC